MCEEHDTTSGDSITLQYVYGIYIDEPITLDDRSGSVTVAQLNDSLNAERHFYHQNTQFSVHGLTTEGGTVDVGYLYDPYGNHYLFTDGNSNGSVDFDGTDTVANAGTSSTGNIYTFTGRRFDSESGLHYFRNRYYSSGRGRFISRDSEGFIDGMNLYNGYFIPNMTDPHGKVIKEIIIIGGGILLGIWIWKKCTGPGKKGGGTGGKKPINDGYCVGSILSTSARGKCASQGWPNYKLVCLKSCVIGTKTCSKQKQWITIKGTKPECQVKIGFGAACQASCPTTHTEINP